MYNGSSVYACFIFEKLVLNKVLAKKSRTSMHWMREKDSVAVAMLACRHQFHFHCMATDGNE